MRKDRRKKKVLLVLAAALAASLWASAAFAAEDGQAFDICGHLNMLNRGNILLECPEGILLGSSQGGILYYPGGVEEASKNWASEWSDIRIWIDFPDYQEEFRPSIYYEAGMFLMESTIWDKGYVRNDLRKWEIDLAEVEEKARENFEKTERYTYVVQAEDLVTVEEDISGSVMLDGKLYYLQRKPLRLVEYHPETGEKRVLYQHRYPDFPDIFEEGTAADPYDFDECRYKLGTDTKKIYFYTNGKDQEALPENTALYSYDLRGKHVTMETDAVYIPSGEDYPPYNYTSAMLRAIVKSVYGSNGVNALNRIVGGEWVREYISDGTADWKNGFFYEDAYWCAKDTGINDTSGKHVPNAWLTRVDLRTGEKTAIPGEYYISADDVFTVDHYLFQLGREILDLSNGSTYKFSWYYPEPSFTMGSLMEEYLEEESVSEGAEE